MRIVTIVGARPQFIKAAAVSRAIRDHNACGNKPHIDESLVHTGQHYDQNMSQVFFDELDIPHPDYNLGVGSLPHGAQTGRMLEAIEEVLQQERPDWVLVYGDTNSTLAGALAAAKLHIPVAHVEAGLRSHNRAMPEEVNRVLTDHVSTLLFCPTQAATANLTEEGIIDGECLVGDVMYDCVLYYLSDPRVPSFDSQVPLNPGEYCLATVHRAESTDDSQTLAQIVQGLNRVADDRLAVVVPLHPRTHSAMAREGLVFGQNVWVLPPVSYREMLFLERNARVIVTDSGGVQKEAYFHGVPCVTMRNETEWIETVSTGWNTLVGHDMEALLSAVRSSRRPAERPSLYGDGRAAEHIIRCLCDSESC